MLKKSKPKKQFKYLQDGPSSEVKLVYECDFEIFWSLGPLDLGTHGPLHSSNTSSFFLLPLPISSFLLNHKKSKSIFQELKEHLTSRKKCLFRKLDFWFKIEKSWIYFYPSPLLLWLLMYYSEPLFVLLLWLILSFLSVISVLMCHIAIWRDKENI